MSGAAVVARRVPRSAPRSAGFSLIELMVAVALGLIVMLAMLSVLSVSEGRKRTAVSVNDANQSGGYAAYTIDRAVRSAGSGYMQRWNAIGGCRINASRAGSAIWPRGTDLPAPFAGVSKAMRLAPVVVAAGASAGGSDVLITMAGTAGFGEAPTQISDGAAAVSTTALQLPNTIGLGLGDLVFVYGDDTCLLEQAAVSAGTSLNLDTAGTYYTASGNDTSLVPAIRDSAAKRYAFAIGSADGTVNPPQFQMWGVDADDTLFVYDLLRTDGADAPQPLAEGITELRVLYGVDTNGDGTLDGWHGPTDVGWTSATLLDVADPQSKLRLKQIVAIRVALVTRAELVERTDVAPATLTLFAGMKAVDGTSLERTVNVANQRLRHRVVEFTVPLRNALLT